jgi:hypothetical protein
VFFKYDGKAWQRITLSELPAEFKSLNLIINNGREEDIERSASKTGYVSAEGVKQINSSLTQPEYRTILREPLPQARINQMCMEMFPYKGSWVMPNDRAARGFIDQQKK